MSGAGDRIELRPVGVPRTDTAHRPFIFASLSLATLVGFVLGIHVPVTRLLDAGRPERTIDLIHAHGQVQLLGFAGLYVIGMTLRLMPRFAGARLAFEALVPLTLVFFVAGLLLRAVFMPWFYGSAHSALLLASSFAILLGGSCFLFIVAGTLVVDARRFDASSLAFVLGAFLLFAATALAAFLAVDVVDQGERSLPYLANMALIHLQLAGFLLSFILGVALRAIPAMVGIERPGRSAGVLAVALASSVAAASGCLLYLQYVSFSGVVVRLVGLAFLALGLVLLVLAWLAGPLRQAANRLRPASQPNLWLLRSAFLWLIVAALVQTYAGGEALASGALPGPLEQDAFRHALGVGVITTLIAGMSMMILPEFAAERQRANRQHLLAFSLVVLLNAAAVLRVAPSLAGDRLTFDERNLPMALGGATAEIALIIFALYLLRLLLRTRAARTGLAGRAFP